VLALQSHVTRQRDRLLLNDEHRGANARWRDALDADANSNWQRDRYGHEPAQTRASVVLAHCQELCEGVGVA